MSTMMRAAVATERGLATREIPRPEPKAGEVLVRVRHAGLNRADLGGAAFVAGAPPAVPGMDFAGEVAAIGAGVTSVKVGDHVMGAGARSYAEYVATDSERVMPVPAAMSGPQAGATMIALLTMHNALVTIAGLRAGESVLVQGATSGVGLMAMKIAKERGAKLVIGTGRDAGRLAKLKDWGADVAIDLGNADWTKQVLATTGDRGVDVVIDQVSGKLVTPLMGATAILGRIVNVGRLGGAVEAFDFNLHALRRLSYIGVTFRTRSLEEIREINRRARADLGAALAAGTLNLPVERTFPLDEAQAAQDMMRANRHFGKIVLEI